MDTGVLGKVGGALVAAAGLLLALYQVMSGRWVLDERLAQILQAALIIGFCLIFLWGIIECVRLWQALHRDWGFRAFWYRRDADPFRWLRDLAAQHRDLPGRTLYVTYRGIDLRSLGESEPHVELTVFLQSRNVHALIFEKLEGFVTQSVLEPAGALEPFALENSLALSPHTYQRGESVIGIRLRQKVSNEIRDALLQSNPQPGATIIGGFSLETVILTVRAAERSAKPDPVQFGLGGWLVTAR